MIMAPLSVPFLLTTLVDFMRSTVFREDPEGDADVQFIYLHA